MKCGCWDLRDSFAQFHLLQSFLRAEELSKPNPSSSPPQVSNRTSLYLWCGTPKKKKKKRSILIHLEKCLKAACPATPSPLLTGPGSPRGSIPKETQFENHRPEPFRLSLRTRLPSARAERERAFTHQRATYQSLGWSLREWRRASPWSQRGRGSRNTKRERWRQGPGFSGAPPQGSPSIHEDACHGPANTTLPA